MLNGEELVGPIKRRELLKMSGTALAASVILVGAAAAKSSSGRGVRSLNPNDVGDVDDFLQHYVNLSSVRQKEKSWARLNQKQQQAVIERYTQEIDFRIEPVTDGRVGDTDKISIQAIPAIRKAKVSAFYLGQRLYTFYHTIEWQFNPGSNSVQNYTSSIDGRAPALDIRYRGPAGSSLVTKRSYFDWLRKGRFRDLILPLDYIAGIKLRGKGDGSSVILNKYHGYIV